ncbi:MAG: hypothetical protein ACK56I_18355, partial [bacterium]
RAHRLASVREVHSAKRHGDRPALLARPEARVLHLEGRQRTHIRTGQPVHLHHPVPGRRRVPLRIRQAAAHSVQRSPVAHAAVHVQAREKLHGVARAPSVDVVQLEKNSRSPGRRDQPRRSRRGEAGRVVASARPHVLHVA